LVESKNTQHPAESSPHGSYGLIALHYQFGLGTVFDKLRYEYAIIIEGNCELRQLGKYSLDDMDISPDFFSYFHQNSKLLKRDPTLFCISAWNDNGQEGRVHDPSKEFIPHPQFKNKIF
jgi:alpha-1,3-mannosyl-glycoprotein beta-1,2-N-acetylglucosaminyltransferase